MVFGGIFAGWFVFQAILQFNKAFVNGRLYRWPVGIGWSRGLHRGGGGAWASGAISAVSAVFSWGTEGDHIRAGHRIVVVS